MTYREAIEDIDELKPNMYKAGVKATWLARLEMRIYREIIGKHEDKWSRYPDEAIDLDSKLLVDEPYAEIYTHWLAAQIDLKNMEVDGFNANNAMFESVYSAYRNFYNSQHMPRGRKKTYF